MRRSGALLALLLAAASPAAAQTVSGSAFCDHNADGVRDAGEEAIAGVPVRVAGQRDAGGAYDQSTTTAANGTFSFSPGNGCYRKRHQMLFFVFPEKIIKPGNSQGR